VRSLVTALGWVLLLILALPTGAAAQSGYKYRDANGRWVFSDQPPPSGVAIDSFKLGHDEPKLAISVKRVDTRESLSLVAVNGCLCSITVELTIVESAIPGLNVGGKYRESLEPNSEKVLSRIARPAQPDANLLYRWTAALGSPYAQHKPPRPYRVPFGVGSSYVISQAYPRQITHNSPESRYAIDFALPDGTPVYAAREGLVINSRHDFFKGGADPIMLDQANVIEVLHDDGTIAVYAHLHWDSIRVRIGDRILRGQYIANSGNTGFSSGPHLHFAVIMNDGAKDVSIPVEFMGSGGTTVVAEDHAPLTAY
jgi:murein DD-endopeptidase MepM/ murein hydrolase activator NlpD